MTVPMHDLGEQPADASPLALFFTALAVGIIGGMLFTSALSQSHEPSVVAQATLRPLSDFTYDPSLPDATSALRQRESDGRDSVVPTF